MKSLLALAIVVAGIATTTAAASTHTTTTINRWGWTLTSYPADSQGYRFTTDTLAGSRRASPARGVTIITDTMGGSGHPKRTPQQGYRFITDTLAPGGGAPVAYAVPGTGFSWGDAVVGAGAGVGALLLLTGATLVVLRRRGRLAI